MRLLSPLCSPRGFCARGAENLNSRCTYFYIVSYSMRLLSPLCSPRVFRARGAENLNSRCTYFYIVSYSMRLLSPLCSPRVFRARGAENLNSRCTYFYIVSYSMRLLSPLCSPRVFCAAGAENLYSRRTELAYCQSLCGYYIPSVRKKQVLTERGGKDIIRKEKQALSPPRVSGRRCGPLFDPKAPRGQNPPQRRESSCCGNPCAAGSTHTTGIPARRISPPRSVNSPCGGPSVRRASSHNGNPRAAEIPIPAQRGFPTRWE